MNETLRTLAFVGVAVVSLLVAVFAAPTINDPLADMNLGSEFYPDFKDSTKAASLSVVVFNEDTARRQQFIVENKDGVWSIPSHNDYPADAAERLANTAASLIGIKRDGFQSQLVDSHEALGVVDPLDDDAPTLKGRGDRLILKDADGNKLVDFIIGKQVEGRDGYYYVRKEGSNAVYIAKMDVDLSTKFSDWVETDLLKMNRDELTSVVIHDYSIDENSGTLKEGETSELSHAKSSDPWTLAGLDAETQELDVAKVTAMISAMDELKLIGVRPKPEGLSNDLKLSKDAAPRTREAFNDLISRGFFPTEQGLKSNEGELVVTTNKGVEYVLRFGEIFTGSDLEIEAGLEKDAKQAKADGEKKADGDDKASDDKPEVEEEKLQGRFLFAFARFDEAALGPKPVEPEKPAEPAAEEKTDDKPPAEKEDDKKPEAPADDDQPADADATDEKPEDAKSEDDTPADDADADAEKEKEADKPTEKSAEQAAADAAKAQAEYEQAMAKYKTDLAAYEKKAQEGRKEVEELNRRFADWYYVISEEDFKKIRLHRDELTKPKTPAGEAGNIQSPLNGGGLPPLN
ncbi:hypothetical protein Pan258_46540 [Symmachiella dynata]|uniref:DUF4340 domain-containing protein n=1 Tax=Symmachiella dynata TaxID=2527995 RepID=UPI00118D4E22|nr:DUF4340 domain-containing protein [Symmachiella dynata]QDT50575.1 hypothetical protein Pan258_46540 [Symmachiella dynata]